MDYFSDMDFSNQTDCLNCGNSLTTDFCGSCGQKKAERITFKNLLILFQRGTLELRSPLLKNIIGLTIKPAVTCREYLDGRRDNYFNPARYAFWLITFTMLLANYHGISIFEAGNKLVSEDVRLSDGYYEQTKAIVQNGMVYFFFINTFIMALGAKFTFRKEQYNLFELYVVFLLLNGHLSFLSIGLIAIGQFNNSSAQISLLIVGIIYPAIVLARIYPVTSIWTYIKSICALTLSLVLVTLFIGFITAVVTGYMVKDVEDKITLPVDNVNTQTTNTNTVSMSEVVSTTLPLK
jgi:hypothetical protein